jgi:hypothetical protein
MGYRPRRQAACNRAPSAGAVCCTVPATFQSRSVPPSVRRRISSLPRTLIAGPLSIDPEATLAIVKNALEHACESPGMTLELKMPSNELDGMMDGLVGVSWKENYVLELPDNPERLQFGNSVTRHRIKSAVKKAKNLGVQVRTVDSEQDLREWYELHLGTMRWHTSLPRPYQFFETLSELLRPRQLMHLLLAEQYKEGQRKLLSGYLLLMAGKTIHCYVNGRRKEDLELHPNDILQWQAIHDCCKEGFRRYNFLEVQEGQQGLAQFKVKWGAKPVRSYRSYYPANRGLEDRDSAAEAGIRHVVVSLWRRVPLKVTELIAARVHKYL